MNNSSLLSESFIDLQRSAMYLTIFDSIVSKNVNFQDLGFYFYLLFYMFIQKYGTAYFNVFSLSGQKLNCINILFKRDDIFHFF
jgi:hypothetical protein